jgi:predicted DNA-binding transcriptional regulator YafY
MSAIRLVTILRRLQKGERLNTDQLALEYETHRETIKRDIGYIREVLTAEGTQVKYDRKDKSIFLEHSGDHLTREDVLTVLLLLHQTRCLSADELAGVSDRLLHLFSRETRHVMKQFFADYQLHYSTICDEPLIEKIGLVYRAITEQRMLTTVYANRTRKFRCKPLTLVYHDHAFYVTTGLEGKEHLPPIQLRLDKMNQCKLDHEKFRMDHGPNRFLPSTHTDKSYNMYTGSEQRIVLLIVKEAAAEVRRQFPRAQRLESDVARHAKLFDKYELHVFGLDGILFWILSQGTRVEVLEPAELRSKLSETATALNGLYSQTTPIE